MTIPLVKVALVVIALSASGVYAQHMDTLPPLVGEALFFTLIAVALPRVPPRLAVVVAAFVGVLGLTMAWATNDLTAERSGRVVHTLGWTVAALGVWLTYASASSAWPRKPRVPKGFGDAERARWREGDFALGAELAGLIIVRAQPSWAALVVETAWPEPRPTVVTEMLDGAATLGRDEAASFREKMRDKGGTDVAEARWELARLACDVIAEARGREQDDVGGAAVGRFVLAAARVVRDDEDATRVFAALILPAIARRA